MTPSQREFYAENGYLVLPGALSPEELAAACEASNRARARWESDLSLLGARGPKLLQVQAPIEYDPLFLDLMEHPSTFPVARTILGDDISMIDNDLFITPSGAESHAHWHRDVGLRGVFHPRSVLMVKVFFLLSDVEPGGPCTLILPGSHLTDDDSPYPSGSADEVPGAVRLDYPAGTAYLFNGRCFHAAAASKSGSERVALIYNFGHGWMKQWSGYEPSQRLRDGATTPVRRQLLGLTDPYLGSLDRADLEAT